MNTFLLCHECNQMCGHACTCPAAVRFKAEPALEKEEGTKFDDGKPRMDLIPTRPIEAAASVLGFGAEKYGERNWELGIKYGRLYAALQRHLGAWHRREELDDESGMPHLAHALCCLLMLTDLHIAPPCENLDDRPVQHE